jgi:GINS complex subunit 2
MVLGVCVSEGSSAADDVQQPARVRSLLKDIRETRLAKIRQGIEALNGTYLQMDHVALTEVNEIRPVFSQAFAQIRRLEQTARQTRPAVPTNDYSSTSLDPSSSTGLQLDDLSRY